MSLRPLIKVPNLQTDAYLPSIPHFTSAQLAKIKKCLPKFLTFTGVDAHGNAEAQKQQLQKQKLKLKAISGRDILSNAEIRFIQQNDVSIKIWNDVAICLNIPFNNRQSGQDEKEELDSKLQLYIENQLYFTNKNGEQITKLGNQLFSLEDLQIYFNPIELDRENFDNSYRQIRFSIAIGAILPRKEAYSAKEIQAVIKNDLVSSLKIMIKNKLPIRILKAVSTPERVLILQSFASNYEEIQKQEKKLNELLNKPIQTIKNIEKQRAPEEENEQQKNEVRPRQQLSNRQLMLILLGLFFIYLFLKINPLEKILAEAL